MGNFEKTGAFSYYKGITASPSNQYSIRDSLRTGTDLAAWLADHETKGLVDPEVATADRPPLPGVPRDPEGLTVPLEFWPSQADILELWGAALFRMHQMPMKSIRKEPGERPALVDRLEMEMGRRWLSFETLAEDFAPRGIFSALLRCSGWGHSPQRTQLITSELAERPAGYIASNPEWRPSGGRLRVNSSWGSVSFVAHRVHKDLPEDWATMIRALGAPLMIQADREDTKHSVGFVGNGDVGVAAMLNLVAHLAKVAAWRLKWRAMTPRPEELGQALELQRLGKGPEIFPDLRDSSIAAEVLNTFGSWNIPTAYPEGCPKHPSEPSGHGVCIGAITTAAKMMMRDGAVDVQTNYRSTEPVASWHSELNKLAIDVAAGRTCAGLHWGFDHLAGLRLGQQVAIAALYELGYPLLPGHTFQGFEGESIVL